MCKKIAQLTKVRGRLRDALGQTFGRLSQTAPPHRTRVPESPTQVIYHLNNKNEDCEFEIQELSERRDCDVAAVKADVGAKLAAARGQLQEALEDAKLRQARQKEELAVASAQREAARRQAADREAQLRAETAHALACAQRAEERAEGAERRVQGLEAAAQQAHSDAVAREEVSSGAGLLLGVRVLMTSDSS